MPWYRPCTVLLLLFFTSACTTEVEHPAAARTDYNAKIMMQKWRSQMSIQNHYPYYHTDADNPSENSVGGTPKTYPVYTPEDDNPSSYYYLVPISPRLKNNKPPTDGFNKPLFTKPE
jgi:hypothetical protein